MLNTCSLFRIKLIKCLTSEIASSTRLTVHYIMTSGGTVEAPIYTRMEAYIYILSMTHLFVYILFISTGFPAYIFKIQSRFLLLVLLERTILTNPPI